MSDEQLLRSLGELHVKSEDTYRSLGETNESNQPERYSELTEQTAVIEEYLAGAREVWTDRKHAHQTEADRSTELTGLTQRLVVAQLRVTVLSNVDRTRKSPMRQA